MKEHLQKVREIYGTRLYQNFLEQFQKEEQDAQNKVEDNSENRKELERIMHITQRKFEPNNVTGSFSVMRQKIEKVIDDGFTFANMNEPKPTPQQLHE